MSFLATSRLTWTRTTLSLGDASLGRRLYGALQTLGYIILNSRRDW